MAYTYKISLVIGKMDNSICPPPFLSAVFPAFKGEAVIATESECIITFDLPQTPADLGPLVRVELLPNP
jgi:hypothetical protein